MNSLINFLNNRYIIAIMVGMFLLAFLPRLIRR
jgi:hypothetical protein